MTRVGALAGLWLASTAALGQNAAPGNDTIRKEELSADLHFLASDEMRGRLTDTREYALAASWIEARFKRLGLKGVGEETSFSHRYSLTWSTLGKENRLTLSNGSVRTQAQVLDDFMPLFFSPSAQSRGRVMFCGYGIQAPDLRWDDLRGDLRGAIVLVLDGEPGADDPKSLFDGSVNSVHSDALRKALNAQARGAAGLLVVSGRGPRSGINRFAADARAYWPPKPPHLKRYALTASASKLRIPVASVSQPLAQQMLGSRTLADLVRESEKPGGFTAVELPGVDLDLALEVDRHVIEDRSVMAMLEGSDPQLKDEAVLIGAHYDHNGTDGNQIYAGADDNGSGTVALIEIAEAFVRAAAGGQGPKRSVLFVSWGSEERCCGPLLGAWAWAENPPWPLEKTVAMLNMDMIGRSEEVPEGGGGRFRGLAVQTAASNANAVNIIGTSFSPDMRTAVTAANRNFDLQLRFRYDNNPSNLLRRSDHWVFLNHGIPALWFHTGLHPDYHTIYDRPEKIDYPKMERIARLVHQLGWDLAQGGQRPAILKPRPIPEPD
jgi:Zn-dependent M28 family amino/carboxypeptidase